MMVHAFIAHALMARSRTRLDGKNPEPSLMAPTSTARSTSTTFFNRLSTRATITSTIKREEKEKPRHSDSGQDSEQEGMAGRNWMTGKSWMTSRMAGRMAGRSWPSGGSSMVGRSWIAGRSLISSWELVHGAGRNYRT